MNVEKLADEGYRMLAVASCELGVKVVPEKLEQLPFRILGILAFSDPVREGVHDALQECYKAGIRIIMMTGDYPGTAKSVGRRIGLAHFQNSCEGELLEKLTPFQLKEKVKEVNIFARILPDQKLLIVNALKSNGEIVAMTGDGVNDAPALKSAHIGISMGARGTDVAREASDMVLVNDDFTSIVGAVKTGRKIYDNIKKAMAYIFAVHIPIAGMAVVPVILGMPVVLLPAHIAFLELIIDPTCSTVFEAEHAEDDVMHRQPRILGTSVLSKPIAMISFLQGLSVFIISFAVLLVALSLHRTPDEARTLTFITMVTGNLGLIVSNLSWKKTWISILIHATPALRIVLIIVITSFAAILVVPWIRDIFHFSLPSGISLLMAIGAGSCSLIWFEVLKTIQHKTKILPI